MARKELTIRVSIPESPRARRWLAFFFAIATSTAAVVIAVSTWPYNPPSFANGEMLSSSRMTSEFKQVGDNLNDVDTRLKALEALVQTQKNEIDALTAEPDCPRGYNRDASVTSYTVCKKGADEMVKVSAGPSAFWIDRYEASVWQKSDASGNQYGIASDDYPASFPYNGQRGATFVPLYGVSRTGVTPSRYVTWFRAMEACRAGGKRLPTNEEWLAAASGTNDPGANSGAGGACVTMASGPRAAGLGTTCVSAWGAQDMIGNVMEMVSEWYVAPGWIGGTGQQGFGAMNTWNDASMNGDGLWNVAGSANESLLGGRAGIPAAPARGGWFTDGVRAGVFAILVNDAPNQYGGARGFRCATR